MTKFMLLGASAILCVLATSVSAQQMTYGPGQCAQFNADGSCATYAAGTTYQRRAYPQDRDWNNSYNRWDGNQWGDRDTGFWPGDVAAGVVGGAVGTAAAIATAPIAGEAYARRNGFVCTPGTVFRGDDGRRHLCQ